MSVFDSTGVARKLQDAAEDFLRRTGGRGIPIPVPGQGKNPNRRGWQLEDYDPNRLKRHTGNLGTILGERARGLVDVDLDSPETIRLADVFLDPTGAVFGRASAPRSHRLYVTDPLAETYRSLTDPTLDEDDERAQLVELRSTGHQTIIPGSIHGDTGELIEWSGEGTPAIIHGDILTAQVKKLAAAALLARYWRHGRRHDLSLAIAGGLLSARWTAEDVEDFIVAIARAAGDEEADSRRGNVHTTETKIQADEHVTGWPTVAEITDTRIVDKVREWLRINQSITLTNGNRPTANVDVDTGEIIGHPTFKRTDTGNAERFAHHHGGSARFNWTRGVWHVWDGQRWRDDAGAAIDQLAKDTVRRIPTEAAGSSGDDYAAILKWAASSEAAGKREAMIRLARSEPGIPIEGDELDADPFLLNVLNGTVNLRTGTLRPHRRDDLITKLAPVTYDPDATCPTFLGFLQHIFAGDADLIRYVQQLVGYSLTGDTREQLVVIPHGTGANGKSTLLGTLRTLLGDYAQEADADSFMEQRSGAIREDIAALDGARFVAASETQDGQRLSEALIKKMTGGERLRARRLYENGYTFAPQFKTWLSTNHRPTIRGTEHAIWRRIRLIPFDVTISDQDRDLGLPGKLAAELPGILNWAIDGCLSWQQAGLQTPKAVEDATSEYREDMDVLSGWIADECVLEETCRTTAKALYESYKNWCDSNGDKPLAQRWFGTRLKDRGFDQYKDAKARFWLGIGLKTTDPGEPTF